MRHDPYGEVRAVALLLQTSPQFVGRTICYRFAKDTEQRCDDYDAGALCHSVSQRLRVRLSGLAEQRQTAAGVCEYCTVQQTALCTEPAVGSATEHEERRTSRRAARSVKRSKDRIRVQ